MNVIRYVAISVAGLIAGALLGTGGGLALGWLLSLGYHKQGPSDPGDGPAYVTLGLMTLGTYIGAIGGLVLGIIFSVRLARRKSGESG